jgi:glycosyltransferase involved in cell wall biosynthesis
VVTVADHLGAIGGTEVAQLDVFEGLAGLGWEVHLLYVNPGDLFERWRSLCASTTRVIASLPARTSPLHSTFGAFAAARVGRRLRPDVFYVHSAGDVPFALAARGRRGAPVVAHLHVPPPFRQPGWLNAMLRRAEAVVTPSADAAQRWERAAGIAQERTTVIATGVDVSRYAPLDASQRAAVRADIGVADDAHMVLFVGRLEAIKGPHLMLEAMASLATAVHLVLCGEPRDADYLADLERLAAGRTVSFLGRRPDVAPLMGAADVLVVPSNVAETQGLVVSEAMACGTPVVASDAGGLPESMRGFPDQVVPAADVARLAAAVDAVVGWRTDRADLGPRSRQWVADHLTLAATVDDADRLLREVAGRND